jgi:hypothetical protein
MIKNLRLSKVFWLALAFTYIFLILTVYGLLTLPQDTFDTDNSEHVRAAVKLTYVRFSLVAVSMVTYPIILFSSLKYAKYFTIALTAWAIAIYIDDYLVLYRIIEYPKRSIIVILQLIRPILLVCLLWMSFELTFTKSKERY